MRIKVVVSGISFSKLFTFVFRVSSSVFTTTCLSAALLSSLSLQERFSHLNLLLLFLNYSNKFEN